MVEKKLALLLGLSVGLTACTESSSHNYTGPESEADIAESQSALAVANTWATKKHQMTFLGQIKAGLLNNTVYVVGGRTSIGGTSKLLQAYNVSTNTWSLRQSLPSPRRAINGVSPINGKLYVTGGFNNSSALTRTLYVYTPSTNSWVARASMPRPGSCGAQGVINNLLYVYAGCTGVPHDDRFFRYNPANNTWTNLAAPPSQHASPAAAGVINGRFYLTGGITDGLDNNQALHVYNPTTNSWATRAAMPGVQAGAAFAVLNGKLYSAGGSDETGTVINNLRVYTPGTNSWANKAPMPTARFDAAGVAAGGLFFVIGGTLADGNSSADSEAYTP